MIERTCPCCGEVVRAERPKIRPRVHRILSGDSTRTEDVARVVAGARPTLLCWDPPFNVGFSYEGAYRGQDNKSAAEYGDFLRCCIAAFEAHAAPAHVAFVWQGAPNLRHFAVWFAGREWRLVPVTKNFIQARPTWMQWAWDPVVTWRSAVHAAKVAVNWRDYFSANTASTHATPDREVSGAHPCPRTVDVVRYFIEGWSQPGEVVADLSLGSGTTLVGAEQSGRLLVGVELEPRYVAVALERLSSMGLKPRLVK